MRHKFLKIVSLLIIVFVIASLAYSYWETLPYATYKTGQEITGFPYQTTSMTVNGYTATPDKTFPNSSTDYYVNVTIHRLQNEQTPTFPLQASNKQFFLNFQTDKGVGETRALDNSALFGITTLNDRLDSLAINVSIDGSIRFVVGNGNYTNFQLMLRAESQQKPLFVVDLQS